MPIRVRKVDGFGLGSRVRRSGVVSLLPATQQYGLGVLAWSPLAGGWLSGVIREGQEITTSRSGMEMPKQRFDLNLPTNRAQLDAVQRLAAVADEKIDTPPSLRGPALRRH